MKRVERSTQLLRSIHSDPRHIGPIRLPPSPQVAVDDLPSWLSDCRQPQHGQVLFAFDGTRRTEQIPTVSNVVEFARLYPGDAYYYRGIGTKNRLDELYGGYTGAGWHARMKSAIETLKGHLANSSHKTVDIDIVGFSRGAALARIFANVIANYQRRGNYTVDVRLRFMGLFETVASGVMQNPNHCRIFAIPPEVEHAAHAVALHERRKHFTVHSIVSDMAASSSASRRQERSFIGGHSNIGGGIYLSDLSVIALEWMKEQALWAGLQMHRPSNEAASIERPVVYSEAGVRRVIDAVRPEGDRLIAYPGDPTWNPEMSVLQADRVPGLTRAEAERFLIKGIMKDDKRVVGAVRLLPYQQALCERGYYLPPKAGKD